MNRPKGKRLDAQAFLASEKLKYQSVVLPGGIKTEGHDRSYLNDIIFKPNFTGKSLLDIGSFLGYFCVEAMKRGAASATGIESDPESVRQSRGIAELNDVAPEFICDDFESYDFGKQRFDTIICLNVLHHLLDPIGAMRKMMLLATDRIIIEFARPSLRDLMSRSLNPMGILLNSAPAILLGNPRKGYDVLSRTYLFSRKSLEVIFNTQTNLYEPVIITRSPFKNRMILEARRRKISHLVVVTGPTSSGKSTLVSKLASDAALRKRLGLPETDWHAVHGHDIELPRGKVGGVIVHYDLLRPYRRSIRTFARDPRCDLIKVADEVTFITLMPPAGVLQARLAKNELSGFAGRSRKRQAHLAERYKDPSFLESWYEAWMEYTAGYKGKTKSHVVYFAEGDKETVSPASQWRKRYRQIAAEAEKS